jgi:hypothetical protein
MEDFIIDGMAEPMNADADNTAEANIDPNVEEAKAAEAVEEGEMMM